MSTSLRSVDVYVAVSQIPTVELRKVNGYALATTVEPITLRGINGYALVDQVKRPDLNISGKVGILAAINKEQGTSFIASQLTFGVPQPTADQTQTYNTTIRVTAKKSSGYSGYYTFQYARYALSEAFDGQALDLPGVVGTTIWGTLDAINTKFFIKLEQYDVADGPITPGATSILLTVLDSSIYYKSGTTIRLGSTDIDIPFATIAPVTNALGFDPVGIVDVPFASIAPVTDVLGFDPEA
jgi:hypothetical protein